MTDALDILVVSDLHYVRRAVSNGARPAARQADLGRVLLRKALHRLRVLGVQPHLLVLLGDLVDDGDAAGAADDLAELADAVKAMGIPALSVCGNHDGASAPFAAQFGGPGFHDVAGYGFLVFNDDAAAGGVTSRRPADLSLPEQVRAAHPAMPLVALQHNPVFPPVAHGGDYPYMPTNADAILASYERAGVTLSLSGHYHAGEKPCQRGALTTYTVPALCEAPFRFAHVHLDGSTVTIREHQLGVDVAGLMDVHCHTEYAYCGTTVSGEGCLRVARALGTAKVCLTEHAFHLYFDRQGAAHGRWQSDPAVVDAAWRSRAGRMDEYRRFAEGLRAPDVALGLEIDLCADGRMLLAPEDAEGWDLLVGAVHAIPDYERGRTSLADTEALFLRETQRLVACPIQVLAHPFRFFRREHLPMPTRLYPVVAELLATHGVAAEVNFHTNVPDSDFLRECLARGVKIALGTDAHDIVEAGEFEPHLRVLERAGVARERLSDILYRLAG